MPSIRAISFDLTGTLISLNPSLGEICVETMQTLGLTETPAAKTFDLRKKQAQRVAHANGHTPTSEARSREYWRAMLWEIFAGTVPTELFPKARELIYKRLANANSWRVDPAAKRVLEAVRFLGLKCAVLSNGDARWKNALDHHGLTPFFDGVFLSSETGLAKPAPQAFDNVCLAMKIRRDELLHVGDSLSSDILPAYEIGVESVWVMREPDGVPPEKHVAIIDALGELPKVLQQQLCADTARKHFPRSTRNLLAMLRGLPEEQTPNPETIVVKKGGSESFTRKRLRTENADFSPDREFVVPANIVDRLLQSRGIFSGSIQAVIRENWEKIVSAKFVNRSSPVELRDGLTTVVVACENSIIRQQVEFQKRTILKKIRELQGCAGVKKISFTNEYSA